MWRLLATWLLMSGASGCAPAALQGADGSLQRPVDRTSESSASAEKPSNDSASDPSRRPAEKADPLFATAARGWAAVDTATMDRVSAFADDYAGYLTTAKTPRRAIAGLIELYRDGAEELGHAGAQKPRPGQRWWLVGSDGDVAAFAIRGDQPLSRGVRIIVVSVDAPRIELEPEPFDERGGMTMIRTALHGEIDMPSWLARPLALYLYTARPGAADGALDLSIGENADDPILVIPDLLPHLSRKVQSKQVVDSVARMKAVAAATRISLAAFLSQQGVDERVLSEAEVSLVPAGPARFIGVDRALIAGYGQSHRAFAYAAVRALADARSAQLTSVVVVLGGGTRELGFVRIALSRLLASLTQADGSSGPLDALSTRQLYARSAALVTTRLTGTSSYGLVLAPRSDDALPRATRRVLDVLEQAGVQVQMSEQSGRGPSRRLAALDMDSVDVAIPTTGHGTPHEVISTLDLFQAYRGSIAWATTTPDITTEREGDRPGSRSSTKVKR